MTTIVPNYFNHPRFPSAVDCPIKCRDDPRYRLSIIQFGLAYALTNGDCPFASPVRRKWSPHPIVEHGGPGRRGIMSANRQHIVPLSFNLCGRGSYEHHENVEFVQFSSQLREHARRLYDALNELHVIQTVDFPEL